VFKRRDCVDEASDCNMLKNICIDKEDCQLLSNESESLEKQTDFLRISVVENIPRENDPSNNQCSLRKQLQVEAKLTQSFKKNLPDGLRVKASDVINREKDYLCNVNKSLHTDEDCLTKQKYSSGSGKDSTEITALKKSPDSKKCAEKNNSVVRLKICATCHQHEPVERLYRQCSRCKAEGTMDGKYYCGKKCQELDWHTRHKQEHLKDSVAA